MTASAPPISSSRHFTPQPVPASSSLPEAIGVCIATLIAVSPLITVYGSYALWLLGAAPAAMLGTLIAVGASHRHTPHPIGQLALLFAAQGLVGPIIALPDTTIAHIVPTGRTVMQGLISTLSSFKQLLALTPPVGSGTGLLMAVWTIALFTTFLAASALAIGNRAAGDALSVVPVALAFVIAALLGTSHGWHPVATGILITVTELLIVSHHGGLLDPTRWLSLMLILAISATVAYGGTQCVGQSRFTLRDRYLPPLSSYATTSPLSGMRAMLVNHGDDPMVTVTGLPPSTPLRLAVMDRFDGRVWNLADTSVAGSGDFRRIHERLGDKDASPGTSFTATFTVHGDYQETWLPLAGKASAIQIMQTDSADQPVTIYANAATSTAFASTTSTPATSSADPADTASAGTLQYVETGVIPIEASAEQIDAANGATVAMGTFTRNTASGNTSRDGRGTDRNASDDAAGHTDDHTANAPETVRQLANSIASGFTTDGSTARALAATLQERGWFSHGLDGEYPSPPGHGSYRLDRMLTDPIMVGDSEQYASLMALMARELGIPSRVVLGFIANSAGSQPADSPVGNPNGSGETGNNNAHANAMDGDTASSNTAVFNGGDTTVFTGSDITAWVEVNLDGLGWTPLNPTPSIAKIPDETAHSAASNATPVTRQPPPPLSDPLREQRQFNGHTAIGGDDATIPSSDPPSSWHIARQIATVVALWGSPIWLALLLCLAALGINALRLRFLRLRGTAQLRIANGWALACYLLAQSGVPITSASTTRQRIRAVGKSRFAASDKLSQLIKSLGNQADYAIYSNHTITEDQARTYWSQIDMLRTSLLPLLSRAQRWRIKLRPIPHQLR